MKVLIELDLQMIEPEDLAMIDSQLQLAANKTSVSSLSLLGYGYDIIIRGHRIAVEETPFYSTTAMEEKGYVPPIRPMYTYTAAVNGVRRPLIPQTNSELRERYLDGEQPDN